MKRLFRTTLLSLTIILLLLAIIALGFLGWIGVSKTDHEETTTLFKGEALPISADTLRMLSWNIGYAGLGDSMDFFYDGGNGVRPEKEYFRHSLDGIKRSIQIHGDYDIMLFQEVDTLARRSWTTPIQNEISALYPAYHPFFSLNYDVAWVPMPLSNPLGNVQSGLLSLSRYQPSQVMRYALPGDYPWPMRLFLLDRCVMSLRYPLTNGKELLVLNLHNSAFDEGGEQRIQQLEFIKKLVEKEVRKGNYVIAGGDWNQNPPGWDPEMINNGDIAEAIPPAIPDSLFYGWKFAFDPNVPTNRFLNRPYEKGLSSTTLIDFFLLSPNIEIVKMKTADLSFRNADHQPLILEVVLKK